MLQFERRENDIRIYVTSNPKAKFAICTGACCPALINTYRQNGRINFISDDFLALKVFSGTKGNFISGFYCIIRSLTVSLTSPSLQGSRAQPWWLSHFLVSERVLFGTWDGVFTSCLINIFGVIVFLRSGWIVAEAGIASSALIVLGESCSTLQDGVGIHGCCRFCYK